MTKRSKVEAYRWRSAKRSVMIKLIGLINGKLLTPSKHSQLIKVSSFLNIKPVIDNSFNKDSSWFAGFFDAEGYFSIRNTYTLTLSVSQKDKGILEKIKSSFGVGEIYYDTSWKGYNYVVCTRKELDVFMEYFSKYPLKTLKHVDYISFRRLLLFLKRNYHHHNHPNKVRIDNLIRLFKQRNKR